MEKQGLYKDIMDSLSAQIAILDKSGIILETNRAWRDFGEQNGLPPPADSEGLNYLDICDTSADEAGELTAIGIRRVLAGELQSFNMQYPCHSPEEERWFVVRVVPLRSAGPPMVIVSHENITPVVKAREELQKKEQELSLQKKMLEDSNTALRVLLEQREQDKARLEDNVVVNIRKLVMPPLEELQFQRQDGRSLNLIEIIRSRLEDIASPFINRLSSVNRLLTPKEIDVAVLVREGRTSKEIADLLHVSVSAVNFHRKKIRGKLGLANEKTNLRSYLMTLL